ncbi:hypothetical protein Droror1_Dr00025363 [Drosera rotundifolia]
MSRLKASGFNASEGNSSSSTNHSNATPLSSFILISHHSHPPKGTETAKAKDAAAGSRRGFGSSSLACRSGWCWSLNLSCGRVASSNSSSKNCLEFDCCWCSNLVETLLVLLVSCGVVRGVAVRGVACLGFLLLVLGGWWQGASSSLDSRFRSRA